MELNGMTTNDKPVKVPPPVLTVKEQQDLVIEEIKKFVALGKQKGTISIEEINEILPPEIIAAEVLDQLMQALDVNSIKITDQSGINNEEEGDGFMLDTEADEEEEEKVSEEDLKGTDPVRLYLRKMGSVA